MASDLATVAVRDVFGRTHHVCLPCGWQPVTSGVAELGDRFLLCATPQLAHWADVMTCDGQSVKSFALVIRKEV
jgi:hypothetical protein